MHLSRSIRSVPLYIKLMRLHRPTGIWLLMWPCWWSIAMASTKSTPDIYLLALFAFGAIVMRSAGCIINDIIDRDIDAKVLRTKDRPLASGKIHVVNAYWLLAILLVFGLVILTQLNFLSLMLGLLLFIPVLVYPYMKRIMAWPQIVLGLTFNAGAIIGWSAANNAIQYPSLLIYAACFFWTMGYDTIYAHQDKADDKKIGVKSTAVSMQDHTKSYVAVFYLITIVLLWLAGRMVFTEHNLVFYIGLALALLHMILQLIRVDLNSPESCLKVFKSNTYLGAIVFIAIVIEKLLEYA